MFGSGSSASSRVNAVCEDLINYLNENTRLSRRFHSGRLSYADAATLIQFCLGSLSSSGDDSNAKGRARALRYSIQSFVASHGATNDYTSTDFHVSMLASIVSHFCRIAVEPSDVDYVIMNVRAPDVRLSSSLRSSAPVAEPGRAVTPIVDAPLSADSALLARAVCQYQKYAAYPLDELAMAAATLEDRLAEANRALANSNKSRDHYFERCQDLIAQNNALQTESAQLVAQINYRPGTKNISSFGGYSLALKRNYGHASASSCVAMVAGDTVHGGFRSPAVVTRFELKACIAQRLLSKANYREMESTVANCVPPFGGDGGNPFAQYLPEDAPAEPVAVDGKSMHDGSGTVGHDCDGGADGADGDESVHVHSVASAMSGLTDVLGGGHPHPNLAHRASSARWSGRLRMQTLDIPQSQMTI